MGNFEITLKRPTTATTTKAGSSSQLSIILAVITLAQFMIVVDFTIVQVALPSIGREFGVSVNGLQWIVTSYGLTLAGFLMLSGRVGDIYGHKRLFIIGVLLFSLASLTGGLAPSEIVLILARVVQGLGAAMVSVTGLSILAAAFPEGKARNRALSVFAAATGSGFAAGMSLGGVITATLGWRWVFDINVPIGLVVSLLSIKYISSTTRRTYENRHLDIFGAVSVTAGLMLLVYSLSSAQNIGIGSLQTLELLLSSVIVLAAFLLIEYRSKAPLMPLGFLRRSSIFGANAVGLLQVAAFVGMVFILTNYLQQVRGYSALSAGLAFVPMGVVFLVVSGFFVSATRKSIRCQTNLNFRDDFADNRLSIAFGDLPHRNLLRTAWTNARHSIWNWIRLRCLQYSRTHGNEERGRRPRFRIDQHFTSNRRPNRPSSTLDNCEF
jgi:EmrB/QacA subfamily drug resistance transporter